MILRNNPWKKSACLIVDGLLAILLVLVMALPVVEAAAHEWVGIAVVLLAAVHIGMNASRVRGMARQRKMHTALLLLLDIALCACIIAMIISALILSEHVFSWLPAISGASWARLLHLAGSHWLFVLAFVHCGLHLRKMAGKLWRYPVARWMGRVVFLICLVAGICWFMQLGIGSYLFLQTHFAFVDASVPWFLRVLQFVVIAAAIAGSSHYLVAAGRLCLTRMQKH